MTFEEQKETIRAAVLAAAQVHVPDYQTEWVQWEDGPQYMHADEGSVELAMVSCREESEQIEEEPDAAPGYQKRTVTTVYRANVDVITEHHSSSKAMDLAGQLRDAFALRKIQLDLDPVKLVSGPGPLRFVKMQRDGRQIKTWSFELPVRFAVTYATSTETDITIGKVTLQVKLDETDPEGPTPMIDAEIEVTE